MGGDKEGDKEGIDEIPLSVCDHTLDSPLKIVKGI